MKITARGLNRATLARQMLLRREPVTLDDAVRRVVALQAQHAASPYVALWNRVAGFDAAGLDAAFASGELVKATLLRATLHVVRAGDYPAFRTAVHPAVRATRMPEWFMATVLSEEDADLVVPDLLAFAERPRTATEIRVWAEARLGGPLEPGVWTALRQYAPLLHAPTGGPWSFGPRTTFVAAGVPPKPTGPEAHAAAMRTLALRYLAGFGPASLADLAQFTFVSRAHARAALLSLTDDLEHVDGPDGEALFDVPGAPRPDEDTPAPPRLMAMWDSVLLAYADRSRVIPPPYRRLLIQPNGDVLPALLIDGYVAGVWRPSGAGIEATAFHPLPERTWDALAAESAALATFLAGRDPRVYRRYDRWWARLPAADVRVLPMALT